jgi:hypothetical protein
VRGYSGFQSVNRCSCKLGLAQQADQKEPRAPLASVFKNRAMSNDSMTGPSANTRLSLLIARGVASAGVRRRDVSVGVSGPGDSYFFLLAFGLGLKMCASCSRRKSRKLKVLVFIYNLHQAYKH